MRIGRRRPVLRGSLPSALMVGVTALSLVALRRRPFWVPAFAGTTVGESLAPAATTNARHSGAGRNPEPTPELAPDASVSALRQLQ